MRKLRVAWEKVVATENGAAVQARLELWQKAGSKPQMDDEFLGATFELQHLQFCRNWVSRCQGARTGKIPRKPAAYR